MKVRPLPLIAGLLPLAATFVANLSDKGFLAIQPPFDSGFRSTAAADGLRVQRNGEKIHAALVLLVDPLAAPGLQAQLVDGDRPLKTLGKRLTPEAAQLKVEVFETGGHGVSDKFEWPPGAEVALRWARGAPRLDGWTLYSDEHPKDSSEDAAERRRYRTGLLAALVLSLVAGLIGLWAALRKDPDAGPADIKVFVIEQLLVKIEHRKRPEMGILGRDILRSVLLEDMSPEDAITRHANDGSGLVAFLWARQVLLKMVTTMVEDLQSKYLSRLQGT